MAPSGQTEMQIPQSVHRSSEITARPLRTRIASVGQWRMHAV
jgi:hypothetical protein